MGVQGPSAVSLCGGQAGGGHEGRRLQGRVAHGEAVSAAGSVAADQQTRQAPRYTSDSTERSLLVFRTLQVAAVRVAHVAALAHGRHLAALIFVRRRGRGERHLRMFSKAELVLQDAARNTRRILRESERKWWRGAHRPLRRRRQRVRRLSYRFGAARRALRRKRKAVESSANGSHTQRQTRPRCLPRAYAPAVPLNRASRSTQFAAARADRSLQMRDAVVKRAAAQHSITVASGARSSRARSQAK